MKINIISNPKKDSKEFEEELINKLDKKYDKETKNPDMAISIGGDGTFLSAIANLSIQNPKAHQLYLFGSSHNFSKTVG